MEQQGKLSTLFDEKPVSPQSNERLELISKWVAIFSEHHHKEISDLGMAAYIEGLKDLTPTEIHKGCDAALKAVDRMPTVAHIRKLAQPSFEDLATAVRYQDVPQSERDAALEETQEQRDALKRSLGL